MKLAFVYSEGRTDRFKNEQMGPSEFFYGATEFRKRGHDVSLFETGPEVNNLLISAFNILAPFFVPARANGASFWQAHELLSRLRGFDCVIAAYSQAALGLGLWKNLGLLQPALVGIQCGLANYHLPPLRRRSTAWLLQRQCTALFASSELPEMQKQFALADDRIASCDFGVDLSFWTPSPGGKEGYLLVVGNDGRRDYETLIASASRCDCEIRLITKRHLPDSLPENVKVLRGDWHKQALTDEELREQYRKASCVVVPLLDSIQPSGQSVAMQAMACGTPVILTRTTGYWGGGWLEEGSDLLLVPPGDPKALADAANRLISSPELIASMGVKGRAAMLRQGGIENFASRLEGLCKTAVATNTR